MERFNDDTYKTGKISQNITAKLFPGVYFYARLAALVFSASKKAKQGVYDDKEWYKSSFVFLNILEKTGINVSINGINNFKNQKRPIVFIGNHMSTLETFLLPCIIAPHKKLTFVVKNTLVEYPVFKHVMRSRNPIVVTRDNPRNDLKTVLQEGTDRIEKGYSLIVFPQTTRSNIFDLNQFNSIGVKLASKTNALVIPVALKTDAWANGKKFKDFGKIYTNRDVLISFGEPIDSTLENKKRIHNKVSEYIAAKLKKWGAEVITGEE